MRVYCEPIILPFTISTVNVKMLYRVSAIIHVNGIILAGQLESILKIYISRKQPRFHIFDHDICHSLLSFQDEYSTDESDKNKNFVYS